VICIEKGFSKKGPVTEQPGGEVWRKNPAMENKSSKVLKRNTKQKRKRQKLKNFVPGNLRGGKNGTHTTLY